MLFREGLAAILRLEPDIEVIGLAGSIREAVEKTIAARPDIILMDFGLPDGSGIDATRQILKETPECKIVFLTICEQDEVLMGAICSGAKGYLLKDSSPSQLVSALRSVYQGEEVLSSSITRHFFENIAVNGKAGNQPASELNQLTPRELDVLRLLTSNKSNLEIADFLYLSENTVRFHIHSILHKLCLTSRAEAAQYARQRGLQQ